MNRKLSAQRILDPRGWAKTVREALDASASVREAAIVLGVSWRTLMRWRAELEIYHEKVDSSRDVDLSGVDSSKTD